MSGLEQSRSESLPCMAATGSLSTGCVQGALPGPSDQPNTVRPFPLLEAEKTTSLPCDSVYSFVK